MNGRLNFLSVEIKNLEAMKAKASSTEQQKISTKITNRNKFKKETEALLGDLKTYVTSLTEQNGKEKLVREKEAEKKKMVDSQNKAKMFAAKYAAKGKEIEALKQRQKTSKSKRTLGLI